MLIFFYSLALGSAVALTAPWWLWKMATTHKYREGLAERLGNVPKRVISSGDDRPAIWIHAVSVGEVIAVSDLVRELRLRAASYRVVISTTTMTGQRIARERFGPENVFYYPFDFAWAVRRYLNVLQPQLLVLAETEFWPRMLTECRLNAIPVVVVNARISDRSYPRYLKLKRLWRRLLAGLTLVLAQTERDVERLRTIGAPADRVMLGGNLKYDIRPASGGKLAGMIRAALPGNAKLLVCGSTLDGEERLLVDIWPELAAAEPELRMALAPRHPERFAAVASMLEASGVRWSRRSEWAGTEDFPAQSVLLLDSIGELASTYSLATVAFVGGSVVPAGGHNPLEPAHFGVPTVIGPHYDNFREIVEKLRAAEAIRIVDAAGLKAALLALLRDSGSANEMGARARRFFAAQSGATARAVEAIFRLLPEAVAGEVHT